MAELGRLYGLGSPYGSLASWNEQRKAAAWFKAAPANGPYIDFRIDCDGRLIRWPDYGVRSEFGWEIDHIVPKAMGGTDDLSNLRARHWHGNSSAGGVLGNDLTDVRRKIG